ncbi:MAG: tripartite tricarboxylate transporter substrate binding protein [Betaproteobacteria bacterium]
MFKKLLLAAAAAGAMLFASAGVQAAGYPDKTVRLVVPYAPGGASDILARVLAQKLSESTGQQIIVDNKPGAGGSIGADIVAKAAPDGYSLLLADVAVQTIAPALYPKLPYARGDLAPVINLATFAHVLITAPNSPLTSFGDILKKEKAQPGSVSVASSGNGTSTHLTAEMVNSLAGIKLTHVPYKGGGAALTDVMGGQVNAMFIGSPPAMPLLQNGKLKALAVTTAKRMPALPSVPTMAESGLPGFESIAAQGIFAPHGTPRDIIAKLNTEIARIIQLPDVRARWTQLGAEPVDNTPAQFASWLDSESVKWGKVIKDSGAQAD